MQHTREASSPYGTIMLRLEYRPSVWASHVPRKLRDSLVAGMQSVAQLASHAPTMGLLHVRLVEAKGLPKLKKLKASNPFAVVGYETMHGPYLPVPTLLMMRA